MSWRRCLLVCFCTSAGFAADYRAPLLPRAPLVDGRCTPGEWDGAVRFDGLAWGGQLERRRAQAFVGATRDTLFLALRSQLPADGGILAQVDRDGLKLVYDDAVELWVDPRPGESGYAYQMIVNPLGRRGYNCHARGVPARPDWEGQWQVATTAENGWWTVEAAIPLAGLAPGRSATDGVWGLNLCRDWKQPWAWSCLDGPYAPTARFRFVDAAPVVHEEQQGDPFTGDLHPVLTLTNPTAAPLALSAELSVLRDVMPELKERRTLTLAPGGRETVALAAKDAGTQRFTWSAKVALADGTPVWSRGSEWRRGQPWQWVTAKREVPPVDFQFAYYPYGGYMRVKVDVANLPAAAKLSRALVSVRRKGQPPVKTVVFDRFVGGSQEQDFTLPGLEGACEVAVSLLGTNVPAGELVKRFERTEYEWERNKLGRGEQVHPPFEPLKLVGDRGVLCVGRRYDLTDDALCEQVTAAGQALLAQGMRLVLSVAGRSTQVVCRHAYAQPRNGSITVEGGGPAWWRPAGWAYPKDFPVRPEFESVAYFNPDGLIRYDLRYNGRGRGQMDGLDLEIPFRADQATMIHAMGDSIRNTVYQKIPAGQGIVWDSSKVRSEDLPKGFCSYIYVGNPVRGLCWFAENDKGMSLDRAKPNLELERRGDQVILRIHLINKPTTLTDARWITFGLQAAPIKPRLGNWRHRWLRERYSLLGTDINWLALGDCGSVYPAGKDLFFWHMLRRGNTEHLPEAEVKATIERGNPLFAPYGQEKLKTWAAHVRHNLLGRYGTKMVYYYNRASYQAADEFQTFQDEWCKTDWRSVGPGNGIGEIAIVPSDSYIDHALWWYNKSFDEGGNRGVYWDNWFFQGSYNTTMTAAYKDEKGAIVPSTGLWGLRELSRRTFNLMNERGMFPLTMPHMTSTAILPLLGFATVQYDWEWKYSEGDFQDRFSREYILLVSNGELAGTWPVLLGDHGPLERDPWTQRTFAAVCLLHELDGYGVPRVWDPLLKPVFDLLDQPGCEAYRYWDERPQPVTTDHPDLPTIVYAVKGKSAVFSVVSYGQTDLTAKLKLDPVALGLPKYRVVNVETGAELPVADNQATVTLKKHDLLECRVEAQP